MATTPTATKFVLGRGSSLQVSTDGTTWTKIAQLKTATFSGAKSDYDDVTNFDSPGNTRETAPTLLDPGSVQIDGPFSPVDPGQTQLQALYNAQTLAQYKLTLVPMAGMTASFIRSFSAYVESSNIDVQFDKSVMLKASLKISGPITDTVPTT